MIKFENVYFQYSQQQPVLKDINLRIEDNEKIGILGESGAGKSTLGGLLLGEVKPTKGQITTSSRRILPVFQHAIESFDRQYTIQQSLEEPLLYYKKVKKSDLNKRITTIMDSFHLSHQLLKKYPKDISGGQLQRLNIIRTLLAEPDILLFDEITSNLDVIAEQKVIDFLMQIEDYENKTMIVISHDLSVLQRLTERIVVLKDGLIVDDFKTSELFALNRHEYTQLLIETFE